MKRQLEAAEYSQPLKKFRRYNVHEGESIEGTKLVPMYHEDTFFPNIIEPLSLYGGNVYIVNDIGSSEKEYNQSDDTGILCYLDSFYVTICKIQQVIINWFTF